MQFVVSLRKYPYSNYSNKYLRKNESEFWQYKLFKQRSKISYSNLV